MRGSIHVQSILIRRPVVVTTKLMEATGTSFKAGNEGLQITRVTNQGGNNIEVQIQVPYERNGDWSRYEQWYQQAFTSRTTPETDFRITDGAANRMALNTLFHSTSARRTARRPVPTKLVFEDWIIHEHTIPFEFKDVPMP